MGKLSHPRAQHLGGGGDAGSTGQHGGPILHLAVHLTLVGALREGEVAGLTPEDIDFDAANGMGTFTVDRSMQRVQKDTPVQICW